MNLQAKAIEWLKAHGAAERSFARALRRFFAEQAERVVDAAAGIDLTPATVPLFFHQDNEHARFMPLVRRNLFELMVMGAKAELRTLQRRRRARKDTISPYDEEYAERFGFDSNDLASLYWEAVSPAVREAVRNALEESANQPYWKNIQTGIQADISQIISDSIDEGNNNRVTAQRIAEQLGGDFAKRRAQNIASTETAGALNAGHWCQLNDVAESDQVLGREWLAIGDSSTRESHQAAHGQRVAKGEPFVVGGFECRYPGDVSLPVQERARCRCTSVAVVEV